MSLVTYVLLCALGYGTAGSLTRSHSRCHDKVHGNTDSEVLIIRFGLYDAGTSTFLDLFSYTGYKYLGLCDQHVGLPDAWTLDCMRAYVTLCGRISSILYLKTAWPTTFH
jgi:hypothetical protein